MTIRRITIVDLETTSLDPKSGAVIEVAACLFDLDHLAVVDAFSMLCHAESNAAESVNGIAVPLLHQAKGPERAWRTLLALVAQGEAQCSYHWAFDSAWMPPDIRDARPAFDAMALEWPRGKVGGKLTALACDHGVAVGHAHRALSDVLTVARLLERVGELHALGKVPRSPRELVERAFLPSVVVVGDYGFDKRANEAAKGLGFSWDTIVTRKWARRVIATEAEAYVAALPFRARIEGAASAA